MCVCRCSGKCSHITSWITPKMKCSWSELICLDFFGSMIDGGAPFNTGSLLYLLFLIPMFLLSFLIFFNFLFPFFKFILYSLYWRRVLFLFTLLNMHAKIILEKELKWWHFLFFLIFFFGLFMFIMFLTLYQK